MNEVSSELSAVNISTLEPFDFTAEKLRINSEIKALGFLLFSVIKFLSTDQSFTLYSDSYRELISMLNGGF